MPLDLPALLNEAQHRAATLTEGPLLVLAGAGSGKTRVLVHRIAHIVETGLAEPWQILAVTFTNKAAGEMRRRLESILGPEIRRAWIGTFHSMCGRLLRKDGERLGFTPSFTIYDMDDQKRALRTILNDLGYDPQQNGLLSGVMHEIDRAKNAGLMPKAYAATESNYRTPAQTAAKKAYPRYQDLLQKSNALDFGDLLLLALELFRHHPEVKSRWARRFRYVLVDEFQDTNAVQFELLKALSSEYDNLMVVGDDDQAIYRWRGAEVKNILDFPKTFPASAVVTLEENYRSSANILTAANAVIRNNQTRHEKTLRTQAEAGLPLGVAWLEHGDEEAWLVAETIRRRVEAGESPADFAILYRQNAQSRSFEQALLKARVPFVIIGATGFFERKEVKDILSYLRLVENPASSADLERIINVPARKIGEKSVERLRQAGNEAGIAGAAILALPDETLYAAGLNKGAVARIRELEQLLAELRVYAQDHTATEVALEIVRRTRYFDYLLQYEATSAEDRQANVEELVSAIAEFELHSAEQTEDGIGLTDAATALGAYLAEAALISPSDKATRDDSVSLLTIHAAKGLEFPVVFLVGMEEETFPIRRAIDSGERDDLEEERRLCYVAITRAMRELNLSAARFRLIYGRTELRRPSRFLGELPDEVVTDFGRARPKPARLRVPEPLAELEAPERVVRTADGPRFRPGSRVKHNSFGPGVVQAIDGDGARAYLTIRFPTVGDKRVVARFVDLAEE